MIRRIVEVNLNFKFNFYLKVFQIYSKIKFYYFFIIYAVLITKNYFLMTIALLINKEH